jgi:hypothetical protein
MKVFLDAKLGFCLWCSNNAMGLWNKIKGKETEFKGPPSVGQVLTLTFSLLFYVLLGYHNLFDHEWW